MEDLKLDFISKTYFGNTIEDVSIDKTCDYLKDDLIKAMCSVIHVDILNYIMKCSGYSVALEDLRDLCMTGLVSNLRKMVKRERAKRDGKINCFTGKAGGCTGGDFIDDLCMLKIDDLNRYKKVRLPIAIIFGNDSSDCLEKRFEELCVSAKTIRDKGYYERILKKNEGLILHKNHYPKKRTIIDCRVQNCNSSFNNEKAFKSIVTTYRNDVDMDLKLIAGCLNDFSGLIDNYEKLMYEFGIEFVGSPQSNVIEYINNIIRIYGDKLQKNDIEIITDSIVKILNPTISTCGWSLGR